MRIPVMLLIRQLTIGGAERQAAVIAGGLDRAKFSAHVACFRSGGDREDDLRAGNVPVLDLSVSSFVSASAIRAMWNLRSYLIREQIQIIHSFSPATTILAVPVARLIRVPVIISSCRADRSLMRTRDAALVRLTDPWVDAITVNCDYLRRRLEAEPTVTAARINICENGVDVSEFHPGDPSRDSIVGTVAGLRPEKDLSTLIHAFRTVMDHVPNARLRIVGDGPLRNRIADMLATMSGGHGELICNARDVAEHFRAFRVFVLPSRTEGCSNALLEAMACGCASVASRTGGTPEVIRDGVNGLMFEPGDAKQLARLIVTLLRDRALCDRLGKCASETIQARYAKSMAIRRYENLYMNALRSRASPAPTRR